LSFFYISNSFNIASLALDYNTDTNDICFFYFFSYSLRSFLSLFSIYNNSYFLTLSNSCISDSNSFITLSYSFSNYCLYSSISSSFFLISTYFYYSIYYFNYSIFFASLDLSSFSKNSFYSLNIYSISSISC
jgi:hypothetical protein